MNQRLLALTAACFVLLLPLASHGQGLRSSTEAAPARLQTQTPVAADYIVAVVNSEPITNNDVQREVRRLIQQLAQQRRPLPESKDLINSVLDRLINDKAQLQLAQESGIAVDEVAIDQAVQNIARQNQIDVAELTRRLAADGIDLSQLRAQLRDQIALSRLRERDVDSTVRVTDLQVDQYLRDQKNNPDPATQEINLAQILVAVPDTATPEQIAALQARALRALERARGGQDFGALVSEYSDAADRSNAGELGLRTADRYPPLFLDATRSLEIGAVSDILRSGAGFHVLKVLERKNQGMPSMTVTQSRARHILLRAGPDASEAAARAKLGEFRKQVVAGSADFAELARSNSQDGSAAQGGDLGWASPGQFVPEFEAAMNQLAPGQISEPLVSRFGVHLIQLTDRRKVALSAAEQREAVRGMLRAKKIDEAYVKWVDKVRGRAYVELREPPQ